MRVDMALGAGFEGGLARAMRGAGDLEEGVEGRFVGEPAEGDDGAEGGGRGDRV